MFSVSWLPISSRFDDKQLDVLTDDASNVRNRAKINATSSHARAFLDVQTEFKSFDRHLWSFVDGRPVINHWRHPEQVPPTTTLSDRLARDLKRRGFTLVGSTICYAYLQATGVVMDHNMDCFR